MRSIDKLPVFFTDVDVWLMNGDEVNNDKNSLDYEKHTADFDNSTLACIRLWQFVIIQSFYNARSYSNKALNEENIEFLTEKNDAFDCIAEAACFNADWLRKKFRKKFMKGSE